MIFDSSNGYVYLVVLVGLYFLPTIIAKSRNVPNFGSIAVINVFLGWTLVGWVVALAMAARSVPATATSASVSTLGGVTQARPRTCPNCKRPMQADASVCPHCGTASPPWTFHAGVWWVRTGEPSEWQWHDDKANVWRWYRDGTPSTPGATDMTPNLAIDPAVVAPPSPPKPELPSATEPSSTADEFEKLAALHERGVLSDEEFQAAKARLLS